MRAENKMDPRAISKLPQNRADTFDKRLNVERVIVKLLNVVA